LISSVLEILWKSSEVVQRIEFIKLFTSVNDNMPWNEVLDGPVQEVIQKFFKIHMRGEDELERAKQLSYIESALESLKMDQVPKRLEEMETQEALIKNQLFNKIGSLLGANVLKKIPNFNEILLGKSDTLIHKAKDHWFSEHHI
jgi:radical SAM superfamily enzyme with C-terminal helix-hairpin-helix motif